MSTRAGLIVFTAALLLALAGCGTGEGPGVTAEIPAQPVDKSVEIIRFGDSFADLATACDGHGHRIYQSGSTTTRPVVIDDPSCPGGSRG